MKKQLEFFMLLFVITFEAFSQGEIYFPPIASDEWKTVSPEELDWNSDEIPALYDYLETKNTKAFLVLKDGRIVLEKYFDDFEKDSLWYWASAGKTLTATLVGMAQEEGLLSIQDKTSDYLGKGWTSLASEKEELITIRHQLTMTTGLDDGVDDVYCTKPECLIYKGEAGTRWAYHNAPYTLLDKVIENASGMTFNQFYFTRLRNNIGMDGAFFKQGYNNLCISTPRSMARFGIMIMSGGYWGNEPVITDKSFLKDMINTSQDLNLSYGYLWWLNGKESCMAPGSQIVFKTPLCPNAPDDMYSALGKNGQILNIVPSEGLVLIRMGEQPDDENFISISFNDEIWKYLKKIISTSSAVNENNRRINIYPNPAEETLTIYFGDNQEKPPKSVIIYDYLGNEVLKKAIVYDQVTIDISELQTGIYLLRVGMQIEKIRVLR